MASGYSLRGHARAAQRCRSERWIEVRLEELDQQARDVRMRRQRLLNQLLADVDADLPDVLAVRAQHDHFVPLQLGGDDEAIEAVVLGFAIPDADEGLLKLLLDWREVVLHPLSGQTEVADAHERRGA